MTHFNIFVTYFIVLTANFNIFVTYFIVLMTHFNIFVTYFNVLMTHFNVYWSLFPACVNGGFIFDGEQRRLRRTLDRRARRALQPAHQVEEHVSDHVQSRDGDPVQEPQPDGKSFCYNLDDSGRRYVN